MVVGASLLGLFIALSVPRGADHHPDRACRLQPGDSDHRRPEARLSGLDHSLEEAAADLGATPWVGFWKVTMPLILPGIFSAFLLSFALSIDDYIITSFVAARP